MSRPSKWWWGLLPLTVLWLLAIFVKTTAVEEDVHARADTTVAASDLEVEVAGRDVTLEGALISAETRDAVEDARGVRLVHAAAQDALAGVSEGAALAAPDAYDWSLRRDDGVLVLSGRVPSASARDRIAAAARAAFPEAEIRDETVVATDAPAGSEEAAIYAIGQAARLPDGRVSLSGGEYSIAGTAPTPEAYEELLAEMRDLPEGLTLGGVDVLPPGEPAGMREDAADEVAERDAVDEGIESTERVAKLEGAAQPGTADRQGAAERAERTAGAETAEGAEGGAGAETAEGAERVAAAETAERAERAEGAQGAARVAGAESDERAGRAVDDERAAETIDAEPSEVAEERVPTTDAAGGAEPAQAAACRRRLAEVVERSRFRFETGSSALSAAATGALDELATVAGSCLEIQGESIQLAIAGHTDAVGAEAFNLELSRRRAQAAVDHLTRAGVPAAELTMTGYGESRPVASNDTEAGRAQNRRIEIQVQ